MHYRLVQRLAANHQNYAIFKRSYVKVLALVFKECEIILRHDLALVYDYGTFYDQKCGIKMLLEA